MKAEIASIAGLNRRLTERKRLAAEKTPDTFSFPLHFPYPFLDGVSLAKEKILAA